MSRSLVAFFEGLEVPEGYKAELLRGQIVLSGGAEEVSEPEPDLVVLERGAGPASGRRMPSEAVTMLVEVVSETSVDRDHRVKRNIYAAGGIPAYLIIDPTVAQCVLLTEPTGIGDHADYAVQLTTKFGTPMPLDLLGVQLDTTAFQSLPNAGPARS
ncbi:Uma2 family endonuclease [Streptomyces paromomycinus]|uniref:Uma2 family endonuclease n=1 Tax=Streptomyces paromomycinus TaxID=92743 RepID=UPI001FEA04DD|nr:Uma2 family endonuclease [Streptomyces paromomycinus]